MAEAVTLTDDAVLLDPYPTYKWMRDHAPIYRDPVSGFYIATRYEDIEAIADDPATFSSKAHMQADRAYRVDDEVGRLLREKATPHVDTLQSADPPAHTKYRAIVQGAFHPRRINKMDEYIQTICSDLIDGFEDKGKIEVVRDFAVPLPMFIIADQLGVPRENYATFKRWSDARFTMMNLLLPVDVRLEAAHATLELHAFLIETMDRFRKEPQDNVISDIVTSEIDGRLLNNEEVTNIVSQLLVAGNETTTNTIAMGLHMICTQGLEPVLRQDMSRIPTFVEETLRLCSALQGLYRRTTREVEVGGVTIPEGATVDLRWGAANRDERKFANPDVLDLDRKNAIQHLTFGTGIHYCLGNALARSELRTAFTHLLTRLKNFRIAPGPDSAEWVIHPWVRGMKRLELEFERA